MKTPAQAKHAFAILFRQFPLLLGTFLVLNATALRAAEDREALTRDDRRMAETGGPWIYNDLDRGFALARETGKPLLIVFRCPP